MKYVLKVRLVHTLRHTLDPGLESQQCLHVRIQVHRSKMLGCSADYQEVSRCCARGERGEFIAHWRQNTKQRVSSPALKPRVDITRSLKQGNQWPHKKDSCPPKHFLKKIVKSEKSTKL